MVPTDRSTSPVYTTGSGDFSNGLSAEGLQALQGLSTSPDKNITEESSELNDIENQEVSDGTSVEPTPISVPTELMKDVDLELEDEFIPPSNAQASQRLGGVAAKEVAQQAPAPLPKPYPELKVDKVQKTPETRTDTPARGSIHASEVHHDPIHDLAKRGERVVGRLLSKARGEDDIQPQLSGNGMVKADRLARAEEREEHLPRSRSPRRFDDDDESKRTNHHSKQKQQPVGVQVPQVTLDKAPLEPTPSAPQQVIELDAPITSIKSIDVTSPDDKRAQSIKVTPTPKRSQQITKSVKSSSVAEVTPQSQIVESGPKKLVNRSIRTSWTQPGDSAETRMDINEYLAQRPKSETTFSPTKLQKEREVRFDDFNKAENEYYNGSMDTLDATRMIEGEAIVNNDPRLRGVVAFGEELVALHKKARKGNGDTALSDKMQAFELMISQLEESDTNIAALTYIKEKTTRVIENPNHLSLEGAAYLNGKKVSVLDVVETKDGKQKAYTIEEEDGSIRAVFAESLKFKRVESEAENTAEKEPEALTKREKVKQWFENNGPMYWMISGKNYLSMKWNDPDSWLMTRGTKGKTGLELQQQKEKNRRNMIVGATVVRRTVLVGAGVSVLWGIGSAIADALTPDDIAKGAHGVANFMGTGMGEGVLSSDHLGTEMDDSILYAQNGDIQAIARAKMPTVEISDEVRDVLTGSPDAPEIDISNSAYKLQSGQGGIELFEKLDMSEKDWNEHARDLLKAHRDELYVEDGDIRFRNTGWLSEGLRKDIEAIRTR